LGEASIFSLIFPCQQGKAAISIRQGDGVEMSVEQIADLRRMQR
jgi:hypothetical protein